MLITMTMYRRIYAERMDNTPENMAFYLTRSLSYCYIAWGAGAFLDATTHNLWQHLLSPPQSLQVCSYKCSNNAVGMESFIFNRVLFKNLKLIQSVPNNFNSSPSSPALLATDPPAPSIRASPPPSSIHDTMTICWQCPSTKSHYLLPLLFLLLLLGKP